MQKIFQCGVPVQRLQIVETGKICKVDNKVQFPINSSTRCLSNVGYKQRTVMSTSRPKNHWQSMENQKEFMQTLAIHLNIKNISDWYRISVKVKFSLR